MDGITVLIRRSEPSEFDQHPYGTVCKVKHVDNYDVYIQVGHDEDHPQWELLGIFHNSADAQYVYNLIDARLRKNIHYD